MALHRLLESTREYRTNAETLRIQMEADFNERNKKSKLPEQHNLVRVEMRTTRQDKSSNVSNDKQKFKDIHDKLEKTSRKEIVILNIGGVKYTTTVETLTRERNIFFTSLFSDQWKPEYDPVDNSIFIDRNGELFTYILEYLRTDAIPYELTNNKTLLQRLINETEYYHLNDFRSLLTDLLRKSQEVHYDTRSNDLRYDRNIQSMPNTDSTVAFRGVLSSTPIYVYVGIGAVLGYMFIGFVKR